MNFSMQWWPVGRVQGFEVFQYRLASKPSRTVWTSGLGAAHWHVTLPCVSAGLVALGQLSESYLMAGQWVDRSQGDGSPSQRGDDGKVGGSR